VELRGFEPL